MRSRPGSQTPRNDSRRLQSVALRREVWSATRRKGGDERRGSTRQRDAPARHLRRLGHLPRAPRPDLGTVVVAGAGGQGVSRLRRAGRRRRAGGHCCRDRRRPGRGGRHPGRAQQPPGGGLSTGGLVIWIDRMTDWSGQAGYSGRRPRPARPHAEGRRCGARPGACGARRTRRPRHTGRNAPPPTTASSPGRRPWTPNISRLPAQEWCWSPARDCCCTCWAPCRLCGTAGLGGAFLETKEGRLGHPRRDHDRLHRRGRHLPPRRCRRASPTSTRGTSITASTPPFCSGAWTWSAGSPSSRSPAFAALVERGRAACHGSFELPFVSWRNDIALFMGPRLAGYSAIDVEDLTEVEIRSRRLMLRCTWRSSGRTAPGVRGARS